MHETNTVNFQSNIPPGATKHIKRVLPRGGRVTRVFAVAVPGEQADVRRSFYVNSDEGDRKNILLDATDGDLDSERYLAGDDTTWDLRVSEEFTGDDALEMEVVNTDGANSYPNIAFAEIQYGHGAEGELVELIRRVI